MPCRIEKDEKGQVTKILCSRGTSHRTCESCGAPANIQCDYPVRRNGEWGTCDRWQCRGCAKRVGPDIDYCTVHVGMKVPAL